MALAGRCVARDGRPLPSTRCPPRLVSFPSVPTASSLQPAVYDQPLPPLAATRRPHLCPSCRPAKTPDDSLPLFRHHLLSFAWRPRSRPHNLSGTPTRTRISPRFSRSSFLNHPSPDDGEQKGRFGGTMPSQNRPCNTFMCPEPYDPGLPVRAALSRPAARPLAVSPWAQKNGGNASHTPEASPPSFLRQKYYTSIFGKVK